MMLSSNFLQKRFWASPNASEVEKEEEEEEKMQPRARHWLRIAVASVIGVALGGWAILVINEYRSTKGRMEQDAISAAEVLKEYTESTLATAGVVLDDTISLATGFDLEKLRTSRDVGHRLVAIAADLPQIASVWIVDRYGQAVLGGPTYPPADVNVADRQYFKEHRDGAERVVGPAIRGRTQGLLSFTLSQRLNDATGAFRGVVGVSMTLDYLVALGKASRLGGNSLVALARSDGTFLAGYAPEIAGTAFGSEMTLPFDLFAGTEKTVEVPFEGRRRVFAHEPLRREPVIAVVAKDVEEAMSGWRGKVMVLTVGGGSALVLIIVILLLSIRSVGAEEQALFHARKKLKEKDVVFDELNHRVKNHMQMICGLIMIEKGEKSGDKSHFLDYLTEQISSMSIAHEAIYARDRSAEVMLDEYLNDIVLAARKVRGNPLDRIAIESDIPTGLRVSTDLAVPLAMLVMEAVTNSLKYAFPVRKDGKIRVALSRGHGELVLAIEDDGVGLPQEHKVGRGTRIMEALAASIGGTFRKTGYHGGTRVEVRFPFSTASFRAGVARSLGEEPKPPIP